MLENESIRHVFLNLSPLSVDKRYFRNGIGSNLIIHALEKAKELGYPAVFLCGDPDYYSRFGFSPSYELNIFHTKDDHAEWCMVKELIPGYLNNVRGQVDIQ